MPGLSFHIETLGCQMNEQDSLLLRERLVRAGHREASAMEDADVLIVNTCSIRQKAEEKAYSILGRFHALKQGRPGILVAVGGCLSQQKGETLLRRMPWVDLVFGPGQGPRVPHLLDACRAGSGPVVALDGGEWSEEALESDGAIRPGEVKAYLKIMEGCDNFCSYCIVPYVRGLPRSRPARSILEEAKGLVARGVKDITLIGQNVSAYRDPDWPAFGFPELLESVCDQARPVRLRFTTSHPKDTTRALIDSFGKLPSLCEHMHLPLQSGSDRVLAAMGRGYTLAAYREIVWALRERCPGISITSDIIVGFPGETRRDFEKTLEAVREIRFDGLFSFKFSPRPGTRAATLRQTASDALKTERLKTLQAIQREIGLEKNKSLVGCQEEILVEGRSRRGGLWTGRTRTNRVVNVPGPSGWLGKLVRVRIERAGPHSLLGRALDGAEPCVDGSSLAERKVS
jgi:tRNA-2-methylthio-N6-dimethylallyladenosine synthase